VRVLVTGATGFLGREVTHQLTAAGHEVVALTRGPSTIPDGSHSVHGDLTDLASVRNALAQAGPVEAVCHLAALPNVAVKLSGLVTEAVPRLLFDGVRRRDRQSAIGAVAILASLLLTGVAFVAGAAREGRRHARLLIISRREDVTQDATD